MEASERKGRYQSGDTVASADVEALLRHIAHYGFLSSGHIQALYPKLSYKQTQRLKRQAKDTGLLESVKVSVNAVYSDKIFGSAPDIGPEQT